VLGIFGFAAAALIALPGHQRSGGYLDLGALRILQLHHVPNIFTLGIAGLGQ